MNALDKVLLSPSDVDTIMGTTGMTPHPRAQVMGDHRNLLPNLNCLGIWQVDESGVYGADGWIAVRQEMLRSPDTDDWRTLVVQSVVNYPSTGDAHDFFTQSSDRWSKCTNHNVNITLNGKPLPKWHSGDLTKTDTQLSIPFTRGDVNGVDSLPAGALGRRQRDHRRPGVYPGRRAGSAGRRRGQQDQAKLPT